MDSAAEELENEFLSEKEIIQGRVDSFVKNLKRRQQKNKKRKSQTLEDCIANAPTVTNEMIKIFFETGSDYSVSKQSVLEVKRVLAGMQKKINALSAQKRLFILETVNLFNSKISISKLIPSLLILEGEAQKKAICQLIFPTFFNIDRNIQTLVSDNRLFKSERLHIERGSLYSFGGDISGILMHLFKKDFIDRNRDSNSQNEFLLKAFDPESFMISPAFKSDQEYIYQEMIDDENILRKIVLKFFITIQSHKAIYNYAKKRHQYYSFFLSGLIKQNRLKGADPLEVSKILAGCMIANDQLIPDEELIEKMLDPKEFNKRATEEAKNEFFGDLSPKQILKLIDRFKYSVQKIYKTSFEKDFTEVQGLSVKNTLKNIWQNVVAVIEKSILVVAHPAILVFQQLRTTYDSFIREEETEIEEIKATISKPQLTPMEPAVSYHSKNIESFAIMTQHFNLVKTSVIAYRGEHDGASYSDYSHNALIFDKNKKIIRSFYYCFQRLFELLEKNENAKIIRYEKQPTIKEYYAGYVFQNFLLCFGVSHTTKTKDIYIDKKDQFPYILLFTPGKQKVVNRVWSRTVVTEKKTTIFNAVTLEKRNLIHVYESIYLILHLLPQKEWSLRSTQICIDFLVKKLQQHIQKGGKLLYCVNVPDPVS